MSGTFDGDVEGIAALRDPVRRSLYGYVATADAAVSRDDVADATGVVRATAAFHLDRLVSDGLLETEFRRLTGRQGPGAGRPAKLYRRAAREIAVSLPPRSYDLAAELLALAVRASIETGAAVESSVHAAARERGEALGHAARDRAGRRPSRRALVNAAVETLAAHGFEPRAEGRRVVLANCPFHRLAEDHTELVCGMNHALLAGLTAGVGDDVMTARLEPAPNRCCVCIDVVRPTKEQP